MPLAKGELGKGGDAGDTKDQIAKKYYCVRNLDTDSDLTIKGAKGQWQNSIEQLGNVHSEKY